jgi:acetyl esterase/lipase
MDNVRQDAYRAMRLVRSRAREWNIDPHRVGILGFSAGGAVISLIAYTPGDGDPAAADPIDRINGKPDFQMLVYPGGKAPDTIPPDAPPAFLLVANDDDYGCDKTTLEIYQKMRAAGVRVEAIFLAQGRHAFNMGDRSSLVTVKTWPQRMADWLSDSGYLSPTAAAETSPKH